MLVEAGANTSQATRAALDLGMIGCFERLLATDQFLFEPNEISYSRGKKTLKELWPRTIRKPWEKMRSILEDTVDKSGQWEGLISLVCKRVVAARAKLMGAARIHFSKSQLEDLGWKDSHFRGDLIDSVALATYSKLRAKGMVLDMSLWPGTSQTVYHEVGSSVEAAEFLWASGFREIDELDDHNMTPLLKTTIPKNVGFSQCIPMILWYLDHGAKTMVFTSFKGCTFVHALADQFGASWQYTQEQSPKLPSILEKAGSILNTQPRDHCRCSCSHEGCSPINWLVTYGNSYDDHSYLHVYKARLSLHKLLRMHFEGRRDLFDKWHRRCPEVLGGAANFTDFCKAEIFGRLGIQHTCCTHRPKLNHKGEPFQDPKGSSFEKTSARPEDRVLATKLEGIMSLYQDLATNYINNHEEFWEVWWKVIEGFVPEGLAYPWDRVRLVESYHAPILTDSLENVLQQVRRHIVRSMEMEAESKNETLEWLFERVELSI